MVTSNLDGLGLGLTHVGTMCNSRNYNLQVPPKKGKISSALECLNRSTDHACSDQTGWKFVWNFVN